MRILGLALLLGLAACGDDGDDDATPPAPAASNATHLLGMHVGAATGETYDQAMTAAEALGTEAVNLSFDWSGLESSPGVFSSTYLDIANVYYPARGRKVFLTLRPVNTTAKEVPADLAATAFDDATMIARFKALLDHVFTRIPALELSGLAIGNEVDVWLGADAARWSQFGTFFAQTAAHARTLRAGLEVGCVGTLGGLVGAHRTRFQTLNAPADIVLATHYPLNPDFTFKAPSAVETDLDDLAGIGYAQPVHVVELGYASGPLCGSSEELQRQFIVHAFAAWDRHAGRIASIYFSWLTDLTLADAQTTAAYYGLGGNATFVEYLRTLGLRTETGTAKAAYTELDARAAARGW